MAKQRRCTCKTMINGRQYWTIECKHCTKWYERTVTRSTIKMDW